MWKRKNVVVVKRKKKRNVVVTLPRCFDDYDESKYEDDKNEDDDDNEDEDDDEDNDEDAVQESIPDNGDEGANNNTAGRNGKPVSGLSESKESSVARLRDMLEEAAADVAAEDKVHEVLNRSAQKGTANPPNKHLSGLLLKIGGDVSVRGMSKTKSVQKQQKHVADRITQFVKFDVFRPIKFLNSDAMFQKASRLVIDFENVPPCMHLRFQMLYESAFNDAIEHKEDFVWASG